MYMYIYICIYIYIYICIYIYTYISKNVVTLKILVTVTMYNIRKCAIRWQIHHFLSDGNTNVCSISHHL